MGIHRKKRVNSKNVGNNYQHRETEEKPQDSKMDIKRTATTRNKTLKCRV